jgi:hypothetical protein
MKGDIWYFGNQLAEDNSIWKFDVSASQWGWYGFVTTSPFPSYPTKGSQSATATPGRRFRAALAIGANNNVFTFGQFSEMFSFVCSHLPIVIVALTSPY